MGLKREVLRGQPWHMGEHEIVPEATLWWWQRKDVTLTQSQNTTGFGLRWAWARPTAVLDRAPERTYRVPVSDRNRQLETWLLIAALLLPIVLNAVVALLHPAQHKSDS